MSEKVIDQVDVKNGSNPQIGMKTLHRLRGIA
jgi:hypothetical protein